MALFKIEKGTAAKLIQNRPKANEGWAYFTTDDGKFYIDIAGNGTQNAVVGTNRICLNAATADKVSSNLIIKLNGGATEGSSLFTYNGSESKVINITPNAIGALASGATAVAASKVTNALKVQGNGTDSFTFDGSAAKTLNIKPGSNVTVTSDTNGNITIASSYTNSRDPGYGQVKAGAASTAVTAITANTSTAIANTYNEILTIKPGNKWIAVAATNSSTTGEDSFTIGHTLSGATAGSYGDSANQTPGYGSTFKVPYVTVDAGGHVTGITEHTVKIPASDNVDTKVSQVNTTANGSYRVLLSISTDDTTKTDQVLKNANLIFNPSTGLLSTKSLTLTGDLRVNDDAYLNNETYAEDITTNTLLVNGNASFVQIPTAPTATAGDVSTKLATTAFVSNASNLQSGTVDVDRLANSGATAGSYGNSSNQTPGYGSTFNVPYITVDAKGRITAISNKTVKIPAADNSDSHVDMVARGTTKAYLLATTTSPTSSTQSVTSVAETGVYLDTTAATLVATKFSGNLEGTADEAKALTSNAGSTTQPIYFSSGKPTATSYALKATVNNATQWGVAYYSTTTNLTSTAAGAANTALMGKGSAAPAFVSVSPSLTWSNGTTSGPGVKVSVLGVESSSAEIPTASASVSGVVNTTAQTLAGNKTFTGSTTTNELTVNKKIHPKTGTAVAAVTSSPYVGTLWKYDLGIASSNLSTGDTVLIQIPNGGHDYGVFLSLDNGTSYKPISMAGTGRLTTHFAANTVVMLYYDANGQTNTMFGQINSSGVITGTTGRVNNTGGCWKVTSYYDSGNPGDWNLRQYTIKAVAAITAGHIIAGTDNGYSHVDGSSGFDIRYAVMYAGSNVSSGSTSSNNYVHHYAINVYTQSSYISNFTAYKNVYIKGTIDGYTFTPISGGNPYVQDITASDDGYAYYYIGRAYSTNAITFDTTGRDIFIYKNNSIRKYSGYSDFSGSAGSFTSAKSIALTGDVTGSASSTGGWSIATTIGNGKVTNAKLANSSISIVGNSVSLGGSLDKATLLSSLGLSSAMHFIGIATVAITDGSTTDPVISGYSSKTAGDVIIDKNNSYEYVWSNEGKWERLGPDGSYKIVQTAVDSGAAATNKWVSRIQQNTNGDITATMGTLDTSGTWSGTATNATYAKYFMNRGANTVTISDSSWSHGQTPSGHTNRETVWKQRWKQSGITYTPSGGEATSNTDTADLIYWLSSSNTSNALQINMAIDGMIYALGGFKGNLSGNASTATKVGNSGIWLYSENNNEINFGGTNTSTTLYFGYRTKDSRPIPTKFIFGSSTGTADLQVKTVYLGSGTSSYISSTQYTGNAATATKATQDSDGNAINTTYIKKSTLSGAYDIMYSSAANTPTRLAANTTTTKKFLRMTGTGSAGAAPAWDTVTNSDVGLSNVTNHQQVHEVAWDSTNKKITRSKNGTAGDVVQFVAGSNVTLTGAAGKLTIASTDTKVTQTATTTNANYEILFSETNDNTTRTEGTRKTNKLLFNPSSNYLSVPNLTLSNGFQYTSTIIPSHKYTSTEETWWKIATVSGYFNFDIYTTGVWSSGSPSILRVNICNRNGIAQITQYSGISGSITSKIKLGRSESDINVYDVLVLIGGSNTSNTCGNQIYNFIGYGTITTESPTTPSAITYTNEVILTVKTISGNLISSSNYTDYTVKKDGTGASGSWGISITGNAATATKLGTATVGSSTKPIYLSAGTATECSTYAGGTAVTLNNASKAASTASFYAPTAGGTANTQALVGDGATSAPKWVNISPSITITAGTGSATPKVNVTVLGQSGTAQSLTTASTSAYGCTILTNSTSSTSTTSAATPNSVKTAYDLANGHKYWASIEATSAATYNAAPEMATIKLNGNTSASAASSKNVTLVYDSTLEVLNFVFA